MKLDIYVKVKLAYLKRCTKNIEAGLLRKGLVFLTRKLFENLERSVKMDAIGAIIYLIFFVFVIYLISRVAHFINNTNNRLNEIDKKIDEIKEHISYKD